MELHVRERALLYKSALLFVESMEDLTNVQKADANELFQSEMNRQIFMMTKNPAVRLIWLKKKN